MEKRPVFCSVCFKPIDVKFYKVDDEERVVHDECYATFLLHQRKKPASVRLLSRVFAKIVRR